MSGIREFINNCSSCQKDTTFIENKINHILHAILTIFLFGTWLLIWLFLIFFKNRKTQCKVCGKSPKTGKKIEAIAKETNSVAVSLVKITLVGVAIVIFMQITGIYGWIESSCDIKYLCRP